MTLSNGLNSDEPYPEPGDHLTPAELSDFEVDPFMEDDPDDDDDCDEDDDDPEDCNHSATCEHCGGVIVDGESGFTNDEVGTLFNAMNAVGEQFRAAGVMIVILNEDGSVQVAHCGNDEDEDAIDRVARRIHLAIGNSGNFREVASDEIDATKDVATSRVEPSLN